MAARSDTDTALALYCQYLDRKASENEPGSMQIRPIPLGLPLEKIREHAEKYDPPVHVRVVDDLPSDDHGCCAHGPRFPPPPVSGHAIIIRKKVDGQ